MEFLEKQLLQYEGENPTKKAKAHILQLFLDIETIHTKMIKLAESKDDMDAFLTKCVTATTQPKLLRNIQALGEKSQTTQTLIKTAKEAEEKRMERANKRKEKAQQQTTTTTVGGITIHVNVQQGGSIHTETKPQKKPNKKKETIPSALKTHVWNKYIGAEKGEAPCICCSINKMDKRSFHAGHVIPESKGGKTNVENLRPICADCNLSMRDTDMKEYAMKHYGKKI
jgi:hypothetical protein